jgi:hypothetical protein
MSFDTLIPKDILEQYLNLVTEHRFLAISGSKKNGKTYLMRKIAKLLAKK